MSTTTRAAYILLALDAGAMWAVAVTLMALWRRQRHAAAAARTAATPDAASAPTSPWAAALTDSTAPLPTLAATDPWEGADTPPQPVPVSVPTVAAEVRPTWSTGPTAALPRLERRRLIHRNDSPAAAEPPTGRYIELMLTRR
jgi:hypothetical protein